MVTRIGWMEADGAKSARARSIGESTSKVISGHSRGLRQHSLRSAPLLISRLRQSFARLYETAEKWQVKSDYFGHPVAMQDAITQIFKQQTLNHRARFLSLLISSSSLSYVPRNQICV